MVQGCHAHHLTLALSVWTQQLGAGEASPVSGLSKVTAAAQGDLGRRACRRRCLIDGTTRPIGCSRPQCPLFSRFVNRGLDGFLGRFSDGRLVQEPRLFSSPLGPFGTLPRLCRSQLTKDCVCERGATESRHSSTVSSTWTTRLDHLYSPTKSSILPMLNI